MPQGVYTRTQSHKDRIKEFMNLPETVEKIRTVMKKIYSENPDLKENLRKLRIQNGGIKNSNWSKGLTKETDERVKRNSESHKGKNPWNKGLTKEDIRVRKYVNASQRVMRKFWQDPEFVSKQMVARNVSPNQKELELQQFLQVYFPNQFKFIGDGKNKDSIIAGKCPDFIHTSKKLIIELFGDYWHSFKVTGISKEQHEQERIQIFESEGYKTLVIWEHELENKKILITKIKTWMKLRGK